MYIAYLLSISFTERAIVDDEGLDMKETVHTIEAKVEFSKTELIKYQNYNWGSWVKSIKFCKGWPRKLETNRDELKYFSKLLT